VLLDAFQLIRHRRRAITALTSVAYLMFLIALYIYVYYATRDPLTPEEFQLPSSHWHRIAVSDWIYIVCVPFSPVTILFATTVAALWLPVGSSIRGGVKRQKVP